MAAFLCADYRSRCWSLAGVVVEMLRLLFLVLREAAGSGYGARVSWCP